MNDLDMASLRDVEISRPRSVLSSVYIAEHRPFMSLPLFFTDSLAFSRSARFFSSQLLVFRIDWPLVQT